MEKFMDITQDLIKDIKSSDTLILFDFLKVVRKDIRKLKSAEKLVISELEERFPGISKEL